MAGWGFVVCVVSLVTTQPLARTISSRRKQVSEEDLVWFTLIIKTRRVHTIFNYAWTLCFWKIVQKLVAHDSLKPCSKDDLINLKLMGTRWLRGMGWLRVDWGRQADLRKSWPTTISSFWSRSKIIFFFRFPLWHSCIITDIVGILDKWYHKRNVNKSGVMDCQAYERTLRC